MKWQNGGCGLLLGLGMLTSALAANTLAATGEGAVDLEVISNDQRLSISKYVDAGTEVMAKEAKLELARQIEFTTNLAGQLATPLGAAVQTTKSALADWATAASAAVSNLPDCKHAMDESLRNSNLMIKWGTVARTASDAFASSETASTAKVRMVNKMLSDFVTSQSVADNSTKVAVSTMKGCGSRTSDLAMSAIHVQELSKGLQSDTVMLDDDVTLLFGQLQLFPESLAIPTELYDYAQAVGPIGARAKSRITNLTSSGPLYSQLSALSRVVITLLENSGDAVSAYCDNAARFIAAQLASDYWESGGRIAGKACRNSSGCADAITVQANSASAGAEAARRDLVGAYADLKRDIVELQSVTVSLQIIADHIGAASKGMSEVVVLDDGEMEAIAKLGAAVNGWTKVLSQELETAQQAMAAAKLDVTGSVKGTGGSKVYVVTQTAQGAIAETPEEAPRILWHGYELVNAYAIETKGYGAYTYVLFPLRVNDTAAPLPPGPAARYKALLEAIYSTTLERQQLPVGTAAIGTNLFCIPATNEGVPSLANYSTTIALEILSLSKGGVIRRPAVQERLVASEGPFLLTTFQPISQTVIDAPLLFADLEQFPVDSFRALMADYKSRLESLQAVSNQQEFKPPAGQRIAMLYIKFAPTFEEGMAWVKKFAPLAGPSAAVTPSLGR